MSHAVVAGRSPHRALFALLGAGLLLGVTTNLAKVAGGQGLTPLAYLLWSLVGAAFILLCVSHLRGQRTQISRPYVVYCLVAALLTVAGSNLIFFTAVGHLGVSFIALMFALPPLLTYAGALLLRMETFCAWRAAGVVLALAGTAYLVLQQWAAPNSHGVWILLALLGPVILSAGNLYRTRHWPEGASAEALAPGMLVGAIALLLMFALVSGTSVDLPSENRTALPLVAGQAVIFAGQFFLLFVLQREGGPVFLSLMGGVSAVFGVPIAVFLLAEPALPAFLPSAALIATGIGCMLFGVKACRYRGLKTHGKRAQRIYLEEPVGPSDGCK